MSLFKRKKEKKVSPMAGAHNVPETKVEKKGFLGSKKEKEAEVAPVQEIKKEVKEAAPVVYTGKDLSSVLVKPRLTEKAAKATISGTYVFNVAPDATKTDIKKAIEQIYKVTVEKVNISKVPKKVAFKRRKNQGVKGGGKKAYVHLKKGDKIQFV